MIKNIFQDPRFGLVWLVVRVWLGYQWLQAGIGKLTNPAGVWVGAKAGVALKGFWMKAAGMATGPDGAAIPAAAKYVWYQNFLKGLVNSGSEVWFSYLLVAGEILVGTALVLGALTTVAALISAFMNLNFMMAGTASSNPVLYTLAIFLILAGVNAGLYGVDGLIRRLRAKKPDQKATGRPKTQTV